MSESVYIMAGYEAERGIVDELMRLPQFRKATRGMGLAYSAIQGIINEIPLIREGKCRSHIGIVVGSSHGELEVTTQFLDNIGKHSVARPILFQNSLHNSTLGFLTVAFQFRETAVTISNGRFSGEDALDTASVLLRDNDCSLCFVVGYDLWVPELEPVRDRFYPAGLKRGEGAGAVLLANSKGAELLAACKQPVAELKVIEVLRGESRFVPVVDEREDEPYYDSDGVAKLVRYLKSSAPGTELHLMKPGGGRTQISLRRM